MKTLPIKVGGSTVRNLSLVDPADWVGSTSGGSTATISLAKAYKEVGWFRSAVDTRANAIATTPWEVVNAAGKEVWSSKTQVPKQLESIANLNTVLFQAGLSMVMDAGAWFLMVSPEGRKFEGLQYLAPSTMEPIPSAQGIQKWKRTVDGVPGTLNVEDVLYIHVPNPFQEQPVGPSERMSEATAALVAADVLYEIDQFTRKDLKRGLIRPVLIGVPPGTPEKEKNRISDWFKRKFGGTKTAGNFGIVEAGAFETEVFGGGIKDLEAQTLIEIQRGAIVNALRVKASMMQSKDAANRAVSNQDVRSFYTDVVIPDLNRIAHAFNMQLLEGMGYRLAFHPELLEAFQAAELEKAQGVAVLYDKRVTTLNEAREVMDWEKVPGGDEFLPMPTMPTLTALSTNGKRSFRTA